MIPALRLPSERHYLDRWEFRCKVRPHRPDRIDAEFSGLVRAVGLYRQQLEVIHGRRITVEHSVFYEGFNRVRSVAYFAFTTEYQ